MLGYTRVIMPLGNPTPFLCRSIGRISAIEVDAEEGSPTDRPAGPCAAANTSGLPQPPPPHEAHRLFRESRRSIATIWTPDRAKVS